jgi:hypothetical protein
MRADFGLCICLGHGNERVVRREFSAAHRRMSVPAGVRARPNPPKVRKPLMGHMILAPTPVLTPHELKTGHSALLWL